MGKGIREDFLRPSGARDCGAGVFRRWGCPGGIPPANGLCPAGTKNCGYGHCPGAALCLPPAKFSSPSGAVKRPCGTQKLSRGSSVATTPGWAAVMVMRPGRGVRGLPKIFRVEPNLGAFQHSEVFFLKGLCPMVFLLTEHVVADFFQIRRACRERSVSILPCESGEEIGLMEPFGGFAFHFPHEIAQAVGGFESGEDVDVIGHAANGKRDSLEAADDTAEVSMEPGADFRGDPWFAVLGREDDVIVQREVGRGHDTNYEKPERKNKRVPGGMQRFAGRVIR